MTFESLDESQRRVARVRAMSSTAIALTTALSLAGCADLEDAFGGPTRERMTTSIAASTEAPPPPPSQLGLAQPPRPRPRMTATPARPLPPGTLPLRSTDEAAQIGGGTDLGAEPVMTATPPPVNAERMLGMSASALEGWLGAPSQRLDAAPARVWRYGDVRCQLDAFLYLDMQTRQFHVLHYEVVANDGSDQHKDECLRQIFDRNRVAGARPGPVEAENRPH